MCNFDVYTGAKFGGIQAEGGLGATVIKELIQPFKGLYHFAFFDFFLSVNLCLHLLEQYHTYSCGNSKTQPFELLKELSWTAVAVSQLLDGSVNFTAWQDKKLVYFIDAISDPAMQTQVNGEIRMDHNLM